MCEVLDVAEVKGVLPQRVQEGTEGREPSADSWAAGHREALCCSGKLLLLFASSSAQPRSKQTNSHSAQTVSL